jgi:hypothetical protein
MTDFGEILMAYSNCTIEEVELRFDLQLQAISFLPEIEPIAPSEILNRYLERGLTLAKRNVSEKARTDLNPYSRFEFGKLSTLWYAQEWQAK